MCGYLDRCFPDQDWDAIGHAHLQCAVAGLEKRTAVPRERATPGVGLFAGITGVAFAAACLSRGGERYRRLSHTLDDALVPLAVALARRVNARTNGLPVSEFDAISGLTGVAAYLLGRRHEPGPAIALRVVLGSLVALARDTPTPLWYTPARYVGDAVMQRLYPSGNFNCGLAHGIPGPLAVLSLAMTDGVEVEGGEQAIDRIARWLSANVVDDAWGPNWPTAVPQAGGNARGVGSTSRSAWCYGAPGVARALWLAGEARDDDAYRDLAVTAMRAVFSRPEEERRIDSPTFCHGVAGLLQITLRFARDTALPDFQTARDDLITQLVGAHESASLLGFRHVEPQGTRVDQAGLLDGAPGILLVLLAATTRVEPAWDRMFLLA